MCIGKNRYGCEVDFVKFGFFSIVIFFVLIVNFIREFLIEAEEFLDLKGEKNNIVIKAWILGRGKVKICLFYFALVFVFFYVSWSFSEKGVENIFDVRGIVFDVCINIYIYKCYSVLI